MHQWGHHSDFADIQTILVNWVLEFKSDCASIKVYYSAVIVQNLSLTTPEITGK